MSSNRKLLIPPVSYSSASIGQHRRPGRDTARAVSTPTAQPHRPDRASFHKHRLLRGNRTTANIRSLSRITENSNERSTRSSPAPRPAAITEPPHTLHPLRALRRAAAQIRPASTPLSQATMPTISLNEARELFAEYGIDRPSG